MIIAAKWTFYVTFPIMNVVNSRVLIKTKEVKIMVAGHLQEKKGYYSPHLSRENEPSVKIKESVYTYFVARKGDKYIHYPNDSHCNSQQ